MTDHDQGYRSGLYERKNNLTGATEWVLRFTHPSAVGDLSKFVWFDVPPGNSWFVNRDDHNWFCAFIEHRRNIAVKFTRMHDAFGFLERLRPAEVKERRWSYDGLDAPLDKASAGAES